MRPRRLLAICRNSFSRGAREFFSRLLNKTMSDFAKIPQDWNHAYQLKSSPRWLAYPYILVQFRKGHVSEEQLKSEVMGDKFQKGLNQATQKISSLVSDNKVVGSSYDPATRIVENVAVANPPQFGPLTSYSPMKLTRQGVIVSTATAPQIKRTNFCRPSARPPSASSCRKIWCIGRDSSTGFHCLGASIDRKPGAAHSSAALPAGWWERSPGPGKSSREQTRNPGKGGLRQAEQYEVDGQRT